MYLSLYIERLSSPPVHIYPSILKLCPLIFNKNIFVMFKLSIMCVHFCFRKQGGP